MCFRIDHWEKRHYRDITEAWKVVKENDNGYLVGGTNDKFWYGPGLVRAGGKFITQDGQSSEGGIYVFRNLQDARTSYLPMYGDRLLKVEVDFDDLLGAGLLWGCQVATYKKVIVPEEQPYIEWYD